MSTRRTTILFVCTENACRSQIAEGFARHRGRETVEAWSAGSTPRGTVDAIAMAVMREKGIDLSRQVSKGVGDLPRRPWDVLVSMGCGDACPSVLAAHRLAWDIPDPKDQPMDRYRAIRDQIEEAVNALLVRLPSLRTREEPRAATL